MRPARIGAVEVNPPIPRTTLGANDLYIFLQAFRPLRNLAAKGKTSVDRSFGSPMAGIFAAIDMKTNRLVWRQHWKDTCYSGSVNTAGGVVFVGRNDGRLTALDSSMGKRLWEFQTGAGANSPASVF